MAIQLINKGSAPNDRTGTNARDAAEIINTNFLSLEGIIDGALNSITNLLNNYLPRSEYQQHFKGVYSTLSALQAENPTGVAGDYAQVDTGVGANVVTYAYDVQDGWIELNYTGSGALNTDQLPEGSVNFYFTASRAIAALASTLLGYAQLAVSQTFSGAQKCSVVTLTSSGGVTAIDLSAGNYFKLTLTEDTTLQNPTSMPASNEAQHIYIEIIQNPTIAKTLAFDTLWKESNGVTPSASTTLSAKNLITGYVYDGQVTYSLIKHGVT